MAEQITTIQDLRAGPVHQSFFRFLDSNGDGTGFMAATGNASAPRSTSSFWFIPASNETARIESLNILIKDDGTFIPSAYGAMYAPQDVALTASPVLTGGIDVFIEANNSVILNLTNGRKIWNIADWGNYCTTYETNFWTGVKEQFIIIRWDFVKACGMPLRIRGQDGEKFVVRLSDNFTHLIDQKFFVQGHYEEWKT